MESRRYAGRSLGTRGESSSALCDARDAVLCRLAFVDRGSSGRTHYHAVAIRVYQADISSKQPKGRPVPLEDAPEDAQPQIPP